METPHILINVIHNHGLPAGICGDRIGTLECFTQRQPDGSYTYGERWVLIDCTFQAVRAWLGY